MWQLEPEDSEEMDLPLAMFSQNVLSIPPPEGVAATGAELWRTADAGAERARAAGADDLLPCQNIGDENVVDWES